MLSVQSPGCAGMERLGAPAGPGGGGVAGGADRQRQSGHIQNMATLHLDMKYIMELAALSRSAQTSETLNLPHRIPLPDGERGPDRHLQLRVPYQQSELSRSAVQPPPNKSVRDVPEWAKPLPPPPCAAPQPPPAPQPQHKKDGLMQKAMKCLAKRFGDAKAEPQEPPPPRPPPPARPKSGKAPCVMVPLPRPPPAPAPPPSPPPS